MSFWKWITNSSGISGMSNTPQEAIQQAQAQGQAQSPQMQSPASGQSGTALAYIQQQQLQGNYSQYQQAALQGYQNQINTLMGQIQNSQQLIGQQNIFSGYFSRSYTVDGENYTVTQDEWDFLLKAGHEALERKKQFASDFEDLIKD